MIIGYLEDIGTIVGELQYSAEGTNKSGASQIDEYSLAGQENEITVSSQTFMTEQEADDAAHPFVEQSGSIIKFRTTGTVISDYTFYGETRTVDGVEYGLGEAGGWIHPDISVTDSDNGIQYKTTALSAFCNNITLNGTATNDSSFAFTTTHNFVLPIGTFINNYGLDEGEEWTGIVVELQLIDIYTDETISYCTDKVFTVTQSGGVKVRATLKVKSGYSCDNLTIYPVVHSSGSKPFQFIVDIYSCNIIRPCLAGGGTRLQNNIVVTDHDDGTITCTGTCSDDSWVYADNGVVTIPNDNREYILTGCAPYSSSRGGYCLRFVVEEDGEEEYYCDYGSGVVLPNGKEGRVQIYFPEGCVCVTVDFKPMISLRDDYYGDFVPAYSGTKYLYADTPLKTSDSVSKIDVSDVIPVMRGVNYISYSTSVAAHALNMTGIENCTIKYRL